jgi:hypothetical protein
LPLWQTLHPICRSRHQLPYRGMEDHSLQSIPKFIQRVMPEATEAELREATATFDEYMRIVWEIFTRIEREEECLDSLQTRECDRIGDIQESV